MLPRPQRNRPSHNRRRLTLEALERRSLLAVDGILSLGSPTISGSVALFEVSLDFRATENEVLSYFALDVAPSSSPLIGPGPDFSAFQFTKATPLLDNWTQIGFFNDPGFESSVEYDDSLTAPLSPGVLRLGTLRVDFGARGLTLDDAFVVAINGTGTAIGVTETDQDFVFKPVSFNPASQVAGRIDVSGASAALEGSSFVLSINVSESLSGIMHIDWGDGSRADIELSELPENGQVAHIFGDGNAARTVRVEFESNAGTRLVVGELAVQVDNVAPTVQLAGTSEIAEGTPYTLSIGNVIDPGLDTVSQYVIRWGDGQKDTILAADLPASRTVGHSYADGPLAAQIVVDIVDEDGAHLGAGRVNVQVDNVAPTVQLAGTSEIAEGAPYTLNIGNVIDPGLDTVSQYVIRWGDGQQDTILAADLPASRTVGHKYADGPLAAQIVVDIVDEDGAHLGAGRVSVAVSNVAPTLTLSGPSSVVEGTPFVLTLGPVFDPGTDQVSSFTIDWGDGSATVVNSQDLPADRSVSHVFANTGSPRVSVDLVDEDGTFQRSGEITVNVVAASPMVVLSGRDTAELNSPYVLTIGPITGPGSQNVTQFVVDWGDTVVSVIPIADLPSDRSISHVYTTGPASVTITVGLVDTSGRQLGRITKSVEVLGDDIVLNQFTSSASVPGETVIQETVIATAKFTAPGIADTFRAVIDWGDGTAPESISVTTTNGVGELSIPHRYSVGGVYRLHLDLFRRDRLQVAGDTRGYITGIRLANEIVEIVGSDGNDIVTATPEGAARMFVNITTPGAGNFRRSFDLTQVRGVDVFVGGGNDRVMISERLSIAAYIDGGSQDDHVQGGDGPNVVIGGSGDDTVLGGNDRDILFGGEGKNRILAYEGDDVLVGGVWSNPDGQRVSTVTAWDSNEPFSERQARILQLIEIRADASEDLLIGGEGQDLYLASSQDLFNDDDAQVSDSHQDFNVQEALDRGWARADVQRPGIFQMVVNGELNLDSSGLTLSSQSNSGPEPEGESRNRRPDSRDTSGDGLVSAQDVLLIFNELNASSSNPVTGNTYHLDTNWDGWVTPLDALDVINVLNSESLAGEGEAKSEFGAGLHASYASRPHSCADRVALIDASRSRESTDHMETGPSGNLWPWPNMSSGEGLGQGSRGLSPSGACCEIEIRDAVDFNEDVETEDAIEAIAADIAGWENDSTRKL